MGPSLWICKGTVPSTFSRMDRCPFATWLKEHPGIELISRDRSGAYAEGAQLGAPQALQVADRFHLVKNLVNALENSCRVKLRHGARRANPGTHTPQCPLRRRLPAVLRQGIAGAGAASACGQFVTKRPVQLDITARYPPPGYSPFAGPWSGPARDWSPFGSQSQGGHPVPPAGGTSSERLGAGVVAACWTPTSRTCCSAGLRAVTVVGDCGTRFRREAMPIPSRMSRDS